MTFDELASKIKGHILYKLGPRYAGSPDVDDAVQEGLIKAWRDFQTGDYDFYHMSNRAVLAARNYLSGNHLGTGVGRRSSQGKNAKWINPSATGGNSWRDYEVTYVTDWDFAPQVKFEDVLISDMDFTSLLAKIDDKFAKVLALSFEADWSDKEIGQHYGYEAHPQPNGYRLKKQALNKLRKAIA
jgi:hypothetical protein